MIAGLEIQSPRFSFHSVQVHRHSPAESYQQPAIMLTAACPGRLLTAEFQESTRVAPAGLSDIKH